jgi:tripartite-type tricarboxylate transporter receptor subunit TctC
MKVREGGKRRSVVVGALMAACMALAGGAASAQGSSAESSPAQPRDTDAIRIVIPFGAGSGTDFYGRLFSKYLAESLGRTVIVENRPGANGAIAAEQVAHAAPDGKTLFLSSNTAVAANPHLMKNLRYDPVKDFVPISKMGTLTFFVMVEAGSPLKSMADLVASARQDPNKVSYGAANSLSMVSGVKLGQLAGVELLQVPYKNPPQIVTDLLGGRLTFAFLDMATASSLAKANKVRALAVLADSRSPALPDVPTMKELGFGEFDVVAWFGLFAPAGTPDPVVQDLSRHVNRILENPEVRERTTAAGFDVFGSTPEELGGYLRAQIALWGKLTADAGLQPQ